MSGPLPQRQVPGWPDSLRAEFDSVGLRKTWEDDPLLNSVVELGSSSRILNKVIQDNNMLVPRNDLSCLDVIPALLANCAFDFCFVRDSAYTGTELCSYKNNHQNSIQSLNLNVPRLIRAASD